MKKTLSVLLALLLTLELAACGAPASTEASSPEVSEPASAKTPEPAGEPAPEQAVVTFADPVLEAMVRKTMGKPEGGITAAEAEAVTRLNLSVERQRYISEETPIKDIGGLESFKNLESLDLSFHAITDVTPLSELKKLTLLSLEGNPVADITPLAGLTGLKGLTLSNCAAQDYSLLAKLVNLELLMLDNSTIADVSPLASLTGLKHLYLADCPAADYTPLADIYPNLKGKDFTMAFTLAELGFIMDDGSNQANYNSRDVSVSINRSEWGAPPMEWDAKCVRMFLQLEGGYTLNVGYYPEINAYVFGMIKNGETLMNYVYDAAKDNFMLGSGKRRSLEQTVRAALGETDAEDVLLAPIPIFNGTIKKTFGMTADALYELPFEKTAAMPAEQATALRSGQTALPHALLFEQLGFTADIANAICVYEQHEPHYMRIAIHRPEWGENPDGWNIEFNDSDVNGYNLLITYFANEGRYHVHIDKDGVDCAFDNYPAANKYGWEYPDLDTVHRMFNAALGTQGKELYHKPLACFEQAVQDIFGMSIDELYSLPAGE